MDFPTFPPQPGFPSAPEDPGEWCTRNSGEGLSQLQECPCTGNWRSECFWENLWIKFTGQNRDLLFYLDMGLILSILAAIVYYKFWACKQQRMAMLSQSQESVDKLAQSLKELVQPKMAAGYFRGFFEVQKPINLSFANLGLKLKGTERVLLEGVDGEFTSGRVAAIMGPSGAGKTTLLNVLCGKATYGDCTGSLLINGKESKIDDIQNVMGFVPQEDIVHEKLTVRENLMSAAQLKHGAAAGKEEVVNDVLRIMQMTHIQESIVGGASVKGISGGQRKRVNIGMELVGCPSVVFLDEPTSGLDSTTSLSVVHSLSLLAKLNMTVIMVIHQPRYSLFTIFDDVCLLGVGGFTAYFGSSKAALPYFESLGFQMPANENPADFFMDAISGEARPTNKPDFKASELKRFWEERVKEPAASVRASLGRSMTEAEARVIAKRNLEESWNSVIEGNTSDDSLDETGIGAFLEKLSGREISAETKSAFFKDVRSEGSARVNKDDLLTFLFRPSQPGQQSADTSRSLLGAQEGSFLQRVSDRVEPLLQRSHVSEHKKAGFCSQFWYGTLHRRIIVWRRSIGELGFYLFLSWFCALIMGVFTALMLQDPGTLTQVYAAWIFQMTTAMLVGIKCSFLFEDKPIFWRERNRGMNVFSFFLARVGVDLFFGVFPMTTVFITQFYFIYACANPQPFVSFWHWFAPVRLLTLVASGWGYLVSAILPSRLASVGTIIVVLLSMAVGSPPIVHQFVGPENNLELFVVPTITRWSTQWIGAAIYEEADKADKCVTNETFNQSQEFMGNLLKYGLGQCESGNATIWGFQNEFSTQLNNDSFNSTKLLMMEQASTMMSSRVKDAYLKYGMLQDRIPNDPYSQAAIVLLVQAGVLYLLTYLALRWCDRDKQI